MSKPGKPKRSQIATTSRRTKPAKGEIAPVGKIEGSILLIRGQRVILDSDLAELYGVETKVLNQAVKRNADRFPEDFMFPLSQEELKSLRSQIVTSKGRGGRRYAPYAFTEHGAIMAANLLNSPRAVQVSVYVVRAFVRLRNLLLQNKELAAKLTELERKLQKHDREIIALVEAIRQLMAPPDPPKTKIGFHAEIKK